MNLLFRTDASLKIGTGHVMRCLALAQAWQDAGGSATFAMAEVTPAIQARLAAESCEILSVSAEAGTEADAAQTIAFARERQTAWIVVDGYQFTAEYQRLLKAARLKILFVDDYGHAQHYSADLVLNQNVSAREDMYADREPQTRLLLRPRYSLLRREFVAQPARERKIPETANKILVTMGGSDPDNFTLRVLQGLEKIRGGRLEGIVLVGGSNPHRAVLDRAVRESRHRWRLESNATDVPSLMAQCDLAVSCAGSTCLELCRMGLPAALVDLAENQTSIAREFARRGVATHLGSSRDVTATQIASAVEALLLSGAKRRKMSKLALAVVDGAGARRVVAELQQ